MSSDRAHVRLAELVAALSLGIDLGFGQPMEHVLRQCRIALRICELAGLEAEDRAAVYYAALLVLHPLERATDRRLRRPHPTVIEGVSDV